MPIAIVTSNILPETLTISVFLNILLITNNFVSIAINMSITTIVLKKSLAFNPPAIFIANAKINKHPPTAIIVCADLFTLSPVK